MMILYNWQKDKKSEVFEMKRVEARERFRKFFKTLKKEAGVSGIVYDTDYPSYHLFYKKRRVRMMNWFKGTKRRFLIWLFTR